MTEIKPSDQPFCPMFNRTGRMEHGQDRKTRIKRYEDVIEIKYRRWTLASGRFVSGEKLGTRLDKKNTHLSSCYIVEESQSLAQMKVEHRQVVPFSLFPLGPKGLGQIQKERPKFTPGFLVFRLMHGSSWPSHVGGGFLVNSFDQSCLLATGSMKLVCSLEDAVVAGVDALDPSTSASCAISALFAPGTCWLRTLDGLPDKAVSSSLGVLGSSRSISGVLFALRNPFSVLCPVIGVTA